VVIADAGADPRCGAGAHPAVIAATVHAATVIAARTTRFTDTV